MRSRAYDTAWMYADLVGAVELTRHPLAVELRADRPLSRIVAFKPAIADGLGAPSVAAVLNTHHRPQIGK